VILAALVLAQATMPPPAPPEEDIVVIARKLGAWRGTISSNPLWTRCTTKVSTGDREIDQVGCTAMERCWPDTRARMKSAHAKGLARDERTRLEADASAAFKACVMPQRAALIEELRARRAAARTGQGA